MSVIRELIELAKGYIISDRIQEASVIMRASLLLQKIENGSLYPWENDLSLVLEVVTHMQDELLRVTEKLERASERVAMHEAQLMEMEPQKQSAKESKDGHCCDFCHRDCRPVPASGSSVSDERSMTERLEFLYTEMCSQQERIDALTITVGNLSANVARWYAIACKKDERYEEE